MKKISGLWPWEHRVAIRKNCSAVLHRMALHRMKQKKRSATHCQSLSYTNRLWFSFKALFQGMWYITWKKKYIYKLEYLLWHMIRRSMIKHCQDLSFVRVSRRLGHKAKHTLNTYNGKGITQRAQTIHCIYTCYSLLLIVHTALVCYLIQCTWNQEMFLILYKSPGQTQRSYC